MHLKGVTCMLLEFLLGGRQLVQAFKSEYI